MARPATGYTHSFESPRAGRRPLVESLADVSGIGRARAHVLAAQLGVAPDMPAAALHPEAAARLAALLGSVADPRALQRESRTRLVSIAARRGLRAAMGLPVRGQRTHGGAKTARRRRGASPSGPARRAPTAGGRPPR